MRTGLSILFIFAAYCFSAQNNVSLASLNGKAFKVSAGGKIINETPQAHVVMEKITKDTLQVELEFENRKKFPATIYLLEKGIPCKNKEFNYRVEFDDIHMKLVFASVYDVKALPNPLVPAKPVVDTSKKKHQQGFRPFL